jgi:hypothetical protein
MGTMTYFLRNFVRRNKLLIRPSHRWKDEIKIYLIEMGCDIIERILLIMADILSVIMNRRVKGRSREGAVVRLPRAPESKNKSVK